MSTKACAFLFRELGRGGGKEYKVSKNLANKVVKPAKKKKTDFFPFFNELLNHKEMIGLVW